MERTCLGCGAKRPKVELIRLALWNEGELRVDREHKLAGRGAYLCGKGCLQAAVKRKAFFRAFRGKASPQGLGALTEALNEI
jgi:predicted RNA-binding protein YlxR (DUF448 family)